MKWSAEQIQKLCKKWLILFLVVMLAFTFLTRALDSVLISRVETVHPKEGSLTYQAKGEGILESEEVYAMKIDSEMVIRKLSVSVGEGVTAGTPLFSFQMDVLEEQAEKRSRELEKLKLDLEGEILDSKPLPKMTEQELAQQTFERAEEILERSAQKWQNAQDEYQENTKNIQGKYEENTKKSKEDLLESRKRESVLADQEYETSLLNEKAAVKEAKWQLTDAQRKLDELSAANAGQEELEAARSEVSRQKQKNALIEMTWEIATEKAYNIKLEKNNAYAGMLEGRENSQQTLEEEYKAKMEAEKSKLETAQESFETSERALKDAGQGLSNAKINDQNAVVSQVKNEQFSELKQKGIRLSIEEKEKELLKIRSLIQAEGVVVSPCDGTLTKADLTLGKQSDGSEQVLIGSGDLLLKSDLDKVTARNLVIGSEVEFKSDGKLVKEKGILKSVDIQEGKSEAAVTISLPDTSFLPGTQISYTCESRSGEYNHLIPMDALRSDSNGDYVLVVEERDTILGKEQVAFRINITVITKSKDFAAVEGGISYSTDIIMKSSKNIVDGDRIRKVVK